MRPCSPELASAADHAACRALIRTGSRSFHAATLLLPPRLRPATRALYAFCRLADDVVDEAKVAAPLARLHERLDRVYAGRPFPIAADRALADVIRQHALPRAIPEALLEGFAWDAEGRRYADIGELRSYAARVAGSVGVMMAVLMGVRDPVLLARACDLGVAMQLSNIARDVGEDAAAGRLYLPLDWLADAGVDPDAWLADPAHTPAIAAVVRQLLGEADRLYARANAGIAGLPLACRPAIGAARLLYGGIGQEVERSANPLRSRAVVPRHRKAWLLARLPGLVLLPRPRDLSPPLDEVRFLIDAVPPAPRARPMRPAQPAPSRVVWLLDLYERLERRDLA
jgi:phytoene synthase